MNELSSLTPPEQPIPPAEPAAEPAEPAVSARPIDEPPDPTALSGDLERLEQRRKELEERNRKLEEDARYWREEKERQRGLYHSERTRPVQEQQQQAPAIPQIEPPKPSDFDDYDKYVAALTQHEVKKARMQWDMEQTQKQRVEEAQKRDADLYSKLSLGFAKYQDFGERVISDPTVPITQSMKDILSDLDNPADVAYYLASNRAEAIKISHATPTKAAIMMHNIEQSLKSNGGNPPPTKPVTGAPPPINPIRSNETVTKDPSKMTQAEYNEWRRKQGARMF